MNLLRGPGLLAAAVAYLVWGLFPLFWSLLDPVPTVQVLAHRAVWCAVSVWLLLALQGQARWWRGLDGRTFGLLTVSTLLISVNWGVFIYGVKTGHVLDTSLGYFVTPLFNIVFGVLLLRERLGAWQWVAVALAALGVGYLALRVGSPPWIALLLATSFASYGLVRKLAVVDAVRGLTVESCLMLPLAVAYLLWCESQGTGAFAHGRTGIDALLIVGGAVTAVPLVLFAYAARRVPLSTLGFIQYVAPTVQLLLGVFVFHEHFGSAQIVAFACIWGALVIVMLDGLRRWVARRA
ncbi:MAG: EamA family transporter RarD [Steroidobacteraceae bacterium]